MDNLGLTARPAHADDRSRLRVSCDRRLPANVRRGSRFRYIVHDAQIAGLAAVVNPSLKALTRGEDQML